MKQLNEIIKKFVSSYELEPINPSGSDTDIVRITFLDDLELVLPAKNIRGRIGDLVSWFTIPMVFYNDWTIKEKFMPNGAARGFSGTIWRLLNTIDLGEREFFECTRSSVTRYRPGIFQDIVEVIALFASNDGAPMSETTFGVLPVCRFDDKTYVLSIEDCTHILIYDYKRSRQGIRYTGKAFHCNDFDIKIMSLDGYCNLSCRCTDSARKQFKKCLNDAIKLEKKLGECLEHGIEAHFMNDKSAEKKIFTLCTTKLSKTPSSWIFQEEIKGFLLYRGGNQRFYSYSKYNADILEAVLELYKAARLHSKDVFSITDAEHKATDLVHGMYVVDGWLDDTFLFCGLKGVKC